MNYKILLTSLLILGINPLSANAYCPQGNPRSTDYIRRKTPDRCEGIKVQPISGNSLSLISIATRNITDYGNRISLQVPRIKKGNNPEVLVTSRDDKHNKYNYILDDLLLSNNGESFGFSWDTYVLKTANIPANKLRALASYSLGSQKVYVPVTLAKSSGKYEFVFYSQDRVRFTSLKIFPLENKKEDNPIYSTSRKTANSGEISFIWDGSKAPGGRYKLHYIAFIDRINEPSDRIENVIVFEHHPNWLK
jgi:flagellar basal-body rod modification protein FlgD